MESNQVVENTMKWSPIPLLINDLKYEIIKLNKGEECNMNDILFNKSVAASHKYDGTNVGKDENGLMYGRNQTIAPVTKSYQKTPLDFVQKLDVKSVKAEILEMTGISEDSISCFNLYGELMCNKGLYNYSNDKLSGTHQVFGVMIRPVNLDALNEMVDKLIAAKFACTIKGGEEEGDEDEGAGEADDGAEFNQKIAIYMNDTFKSVLEKHNIPMVPMAGTYPSFYELAMANFEWMKNGMGEGLVIAGPADGSQTHVSKWKIGAETSGDNFSTLTNCLNAIEDDTENKLFGDNKEKAIELFTNMLKVESSKLINGEIPKPPVKVEKGKQVKKGNNVIVLNEEEQKEYDEAIKSAKSKYDHEDTYFAKGMKGTEEYCQILSKECLNDIKIDEKDKEAMAKHLGYIKQVMKEGFIAFNKNKAAKK